MKISEAIIALEACLDSFGDVEFSFTSSAAGNPAIELKDVDTTSVKDALEDIEDEIHAIEEGVIRRFNARFPTKDIFIASRN